MQSQLIGKDPDAGKDSRQKERRVADDEMVGWYQRLNGHEFEQAPGDGEGQRLACCSHKELDTTWRKALSLHYSSQGADIKETLSLLQSLSLGHPLGAEKIP